MNTHFKHLLLSTILSLPVTITYCGAMEQPLSPNDFQQKMNLAIHDYFKHLGQMKAQELGIPNKIESAPTKPKKTLLELVVHKRNLDEKATLNHIQPLRQYWINQDPEFGNTIESILQKINTRETVTGKGWTLLHMAASYGEEGLARYFLKNNALIVPDKDGLFPHQIGKNEGLIIIYHTRTTRHIKSITNHGHHALKNYTWPEGFDILANPNVREISSGNAYTPLHTAMLYGDYPFVNYLLANGALIVKDTKGKLPYEVLLSPDFISQKVDYKQAKKLLNAMRTQGALVSKYDWPEGQDLLMSPNCRATNNGYNWTPLHAAAHHWDVPFAQYLLKIGAQIMKNAHGKYPHEMSSKQTDLPQKDHEECRRLLAEAYLKTLMAEDRTIDVSHLQEFWILPSSHFQSIKIKGDLTDVQLYTFMQLPTTLKKVDISACTGLSTVAHSILALMFNQVKENYWYPQGHLDNSDLEAKAIGKALAMNTTIPTLSLQQRSGDAIAIEVAKALRVNRTLEDLKLYENRNISDAGAIELAKALPFNTTLKYLHLYSNSITDKGAIELGKALGANTGMIILELRNNKIGDIGAAAIAEGLKTNTTLRHLTLDENSITDMGAEALLGSLQVNKSLLKLKLDYKGVHEKWAPKIWAALDKNIPHTAQRVLENSIGGNLNLTNMTIDAEAATLLGKALTFNSTIVYLELFGCQLGPDLTTSIIRGLATNKTLKQLALGENKMGDQGARALGEVLSLNTTLSYINLYNNDMTDEGIIALYKGLELNPDSALEELRVDLNTYGQKAVTEIARVLTKNTSFKNLNLSGSIGDEAARALAEMLKVNRSIRDIGLGLDDASDDGYRALAEALEVNTTLKNFSISSKKTINSGAIRMAFALAKNTSLKYLHVDVKGGNDNVGKEFIVALGKNTTLDNLSLKGTNMSEPVKKDLLVLKVRGKLYINL